MLSIETTTKLLKLHLQWPDRKRFEAKDDQPMEYFKWLFLNHHNRPEVMELEDVHDIEGFLTKNKHVLWPTRTEEEKWANLRLEPRIENDVTVEMTVIQCDDIELIGTTLNGRTLDIGLHGMRLTVTNTVPAGTILRVAVRKDGASDTSYPLSAELRWTTNLEEGYLIGIKLIEDDDFDAWQTDFGKVFVAPVMARKRSTRQNT